MKQSLITGAALAALLTVPAFAADLPARLPITAPTAVAPPPDWAGFYVGANLGAIGTSGDTSHQCIDPTGTFNGFGCDQIPAASVSGTGVIGGVQAGYNWQAGLWVYGLEGDIQGTSLNGKSSIVGAFPLNGVVGIADPADSNFTASERLNWLSTVRGRVGLTSGPVLIYATGGAAMGGVNVTSNLSSVMSGTSYPSSTSSTRIGWTAGEGVEWAFAARWTAKVEGLYYDLGHVKTLGTSLPVGATGFGEGAKVAISGWIARVGVSYQLGGPR